MAREYTNKILEMLDEGMFDKDMLIRDLLSWMSENDVKAFYYAYDLDPSRHDYEDGEEGEVMAW
jgi:hypothetical protein